MGDSQLTTDAVRLRHAETRKRASSKTVFVDPLLYPCVISPPQLPNFTIFRFVRAENEATKTKRQTKAITPSANVGVRGKKGSRPKKTQGQADREASGARREANSRPSQTGNGRSARLAHQLFISCERGEVRGCPIQQHPRKDVIFCRAPCFLFRAILPLAAQAGEPVVNTSIFHGSKKKRKKKVDARHLHLVYSFPAAPLQLPTLV